MMMISLPANSHIYLPAKTSHIMWASLTLILTSIPLFIHQRIFPTLFHALLCLPLSSIGRYSRTKNLVLLCLVYNVYERLCLSSRVSQCVVFDKRRFSLTRLDCNFCLLFFFFLIMSCRVLLAWNGLASLFSMKQNEHKWQCPVSWITLHDKTCIGKRLVSPFISWTKPFLCSPFHFETNLIDQSRWMRWPTAWLTNITNNSFEQ